MEEKREIDRIHLSMHKQVTAALRQAARKAGQNLSVCAERLLAEKLKVKL